VDNTCKDCEDENCGFCTGPGRGTCIQCASGNYMRVYNKCVDCAAEDSCLKELCDPMTTSIELPQLEFSSTNTDNIPVEDLEDGDITAPNRDISSFTFELKFDKLDKFGSQL
jgi:hypothetical protein